MDERFKDVVPPLTYEDIAAFANNNVFTAPKILNPWMQGNIKGVVNVGSALPGDSGKIQLDGNNQRILIFDNSNARVLLGKDV